MPEELNTLALELIAAITRQRASGPVRPNDRLIAAFLDKVPDPPFLAGDPSCSALNLAQWIRRRQSGERMKHRSVAGLLHLAHAHQANSEVANVLRRLSSVVRNSDFASHSAVAEALDLIARDDGSAHLDVPRMQSSGKSIFLLLGSFPRRIDQATESFHEQVASAIGRQLADTSHDLIHGGCTNCWAYLALQEFAAAGGSVDQRVTTYLPQSLANEELRWRDDYEVIGRLIVIGALPDDRRAAMVASADVILCMSGKLGTPACLQMAKDGSVPVVPIPQLGGTSADEFARQVGDPLCDRVYQKALLEMGRQSAAAPAEIATSAVSLIDLVLARDDASRT